MSPGEFYKSRTWVSNSFGIKKYEIDVARKIVLQGQKRFQSVEERYAGCITVDEYLLVAVPKTEIQVYLEYCTSVRQENMSAVVNRCSIPSLPAETDANLASTRSRRLEAEWNSESGRTGLSSRRR